MPADVDVWSSEYGHLTLREELDVFVSEYGRYMHPATLDVFEDILHRRFCTPEGDCRCRNLKDV